MDLSFPPPRDGPLTFHHLPLELKIEVIELLYGSHGASVKPIMGPDAAWVNPYYHLGVIDGNNLGPAEEISVTFARDTEQSPLKSLRLVSREYNAICMPFLYRQLDLEVPRGDTTASLEEIHENIATYGKYVRYIRIYIRGYENVLWWYTVNILAKIVAECRLTTTIAIYYNNGMEPDLGPLATEVVRMVESSQVTQIGIYSTRILPAKGGRSIQSRPHYNSAMQLLKALLSSPEACQALLRLDIVLEYLSIECFELLRRNLQSLKSLTVRRAFRHDRMSNIWGPGETYWWALSVNLTRLVLMECSRPGAKHLVGLVARFPALRHLVWASCGTRQEPIPPLPDAGWSDDFKNQSSRRPNLEMFHIEGAVEWDLCWLGLISAETVMVLHPDESELANALDREVEMFLGMKKLRVLPPSNPKLLEPGIQGGIELPQPNGRNLDDICAERDVTLLRDGQLLRGPSVVRRPRRPVVLERSPLGVLVPRAAGTEVIFSG